VSLKTEVETVRRRHIVHTSACLLHPLLSLQATQPYTQQMTLCRFAYIDELSTYPKHVFRRDGNALGILSSSGGRHHGGCRRDILMVIHHHHCLHRVGRHGQKVSSLRFVRTRLFRQKRVFPRTRQTNDSRHPSIKKWMSTEQTAFGISVELYV